MDGHVENGKIHSNVFVYLDIKIGDEKGIQCTTAIIYSFDITYNSFSFNYLFSWEGSN